MPYRTIETSIWTDPKIKGLDAKGKLLFVYLFTNTHTHVSGLYYLPDLIVEHETAIPKRQVDALWDTLSKGYLVKRDRVSEVVWVVNMLKFQGKGEKIRLSCEAHLSTLHKCVLIKDFLEYYKEFGIGYRYPIEGVSSRARVEQEQDKEQEQEPSSSRLPSDEARRLASELQFLILRNNPDAKITESQIGHWAKDADLLLRIDKRTSEQAMEVLRWSQRDDFWKQNILSIGKFRQKYDQLLVKMRAQNGQGKLTAGQRTAQNISKTFGTGKVVDDLF